MTKKFELAQLKSECRKIAERSANRNGFVPIYSLAALLECEVIRRPLLVEAGVTYRIDDPNKWVVLVNEDIHKFSDASFHCESHLDPLNPRTRNTLAHEIAHILVIKRLGYDIRQRGISEERVEAVESLVEKISPLLLVPQNRLLGLLEGIKPGLDTVNEFRNLCELFAVSAPVFLTALRNANRTHRSRVIGIDALINRGFGIAEWKNKRTFVTKCRGFFGNYHNVSPPFPDFVMTKYRYIEWRVMKSLVANGITQAVVQSDGIEESVTLNILLEERRTSRAKRFFFEII